MKNREMSPGPAILQLGELVVDFDRQQVWRGGARIDLPGLSFRLLEVLLRRSGDAVSRKDLRRAVWGDIVVSDEALRQRVRLLRRALGDDRYVATVKGIGYRIAMPVMKASSPPSRNRPWLAAAAIIAALALLALLAVGVIPEAKHALLHALRH